MVSITLTIDDAKYSDFKLAFLRTKPVPLDEEGVPSHTENQWIKKVIKDFMFKYYSDGKKILSIEANNPNVDQDIIN